MAEDKKDVHSKLNERLKELLTKFTNDGGKFSTLQEVSDLQRMVQGEMKNGAFPFMHARAPIDVGVDSMNELWKRALRDNILAAHAELSETLEWAPWKPWRTSAPQMTESDVQNMKFEIVDTLCFMLNVWHLIGGTGEELALMHRAKSEENIRRQREGY
jgi:hypothetical protein